VCNVVVSDVDSTCYIIQNFSGVSFSVLFLFKIKSYLLNGNFFTCILQCIWTPRLLLTNVNLGLLTDNKNKHIHVIIAAVIMFQKKPQDI
jgi:hypothetical protein